MYTSRIDRTITVNIIMRTLYHHLLSPACRKIRIIMSEKKLDFSLVYERIWHPRDEFLSLNPSGEVPVLVDLNDKTICNNHAISEYLEEAYPDHPLIGDDLYQKAEVRRLMGWFDDKFDQEVSQKIVFEKILKHQFGLGQPDTRIIRQGLASIHDHLTYIEWLIERRIWLAGDNFSIADIAAVAHLSTIDYLGDVPWAKYPEAKDWYVRIKSRPSFRPILQDIYPGVAPPAHYADLDF